MNLVQMSISGAVMILFTVAIRALSIRRLPKKTFLFLWWIVMARLLVPYSLPCELSVYSLFAHKGTAKATGNINIQVIPNIPMEKSMEKSSEIPPEVLITPNVQHIDIFKVVWLTGALAAVVCFAVSYIRCLRLFRESLPVYNERISQWLAEHRCFRQISVRQYDRISSPLTYGIFRPVILLPKNFKYIDTDDLKFVLAHEYTHIRRFDLVFKLVLIAALCVHWFNPLVWLMYIIANRDIELSCDENVVRMFGEERKQDYAMSLIRMEEIKNGLVPLINHFGKNAVKERIVAIMKFRKLTVPAVAAAVCLVAGTTTVFATTATNNTKPMDNSVTEPKNTKSVFVSVDADAPVIRRDGDMNIVYEDPNFTLATQDIPLVSDVTADYDTPILVSRNEYSDGDYRYVDEIYSYPVNNQMRSLKKKHQVAVHTIYYEPDNTSSIRLAEMCIEADFYYDAEQNYAYCDEESVSCSVKKTTNDKYPVYYETYKRCQSGLPGDDYNYAQVVYEIQLYKSSTEYDVHRMVLTVNANGEPKMGCIH